MFAKIKYILLVIFFRKVSPAFVYFQKILLGNPSDYFDLFAAFVTYYILKFIEFSFLCSILAHKSTSFEVYAYIISTIYSRFQWEALLYFPFIWQHLHSLAMHVLLDCHKNSYEFHLLQIHFFCKMQLLARC